MKLAPFRPIDVAIATVCGVLALVLFLSTRSDRSIGTKVVIETVSGATETYSLSEPVSVTVDGQDGHTLTVTIQDGAVCVTESTCPDHLCEQGGWFSESGRSAVCVPAGISVRVVGNRQTVDGVTG